jgi:hypothetical protein
MMARSIHSASMAAALALASTLGCAPADKSASAGAELTPFAHERLGDDVPHPTFIDFGGKVQIVGYDVSTEDSAGPGASVHVKLYWRRTGDLDAGWGLFTHLEDDQGRQIANLDREGPFRKALGDKPEGLSLLELGKVYTDEQAFQMPKAEDLTPRVTLVVGVWNDQMRLSVVSGESNGHDASIITHFVTGVSRRKLPTGPQG